MDWKVELWRFFAFFVSLVSVVGFANAPLKRRIEELENDNRKNPKRTVPDCEALMGKCPIQAQMIVFADDFTEIKGCLTELRNDMKEHLKFHLEEKRG